MNRSDETVIVEPCSQTEGKGRVSIVLDGERVKNIYFQALEYRGFERFIKGRLMEDIPRIVTRISGDCSFSHQIASVRAIEEILDISVTKAGEMLRKLSLYANTLYSHLHHFFFKALPGLRSSPKDTPVDNVLEVLQKLPEMSRNALKHQAEIAKMLEIIGGKPLHPTIAVPGGVSKTLTEREGEEVREKTQEVLHFILEALDSFKREVIQNEKYEDLFFGDPHHLKTYYMGLIGEAGSGNFYDGNVKVLDPTGKEFTTFSPSEALDHISEKSQPWSYAKFPYLQDVGWNGLEEGRNSGVFRVGPLPRLNVTDQLSTAKAQEAYEDFTEALGKPAESGFAFHWSRVIEMVYCCERILGLLENPVIVEGAPRNYAEEHEGLTTDTGIGIIEAPRGLLVHHYEVDQEGKVVKANVIPPSTMNNGAMCLEMRKLVGTQIKSGEISEKVKNRIKLLCNAYNPCIPGSTH